MTSHAAARKKVLSSLGEKTLEEAIAEQKATIERADAVVADAGALTKARAEQIAAAQAEYGQAQAKVTSAMSSEVEAAKHFRATKQKFDDACTKVGDTRKQLIEAQKNFAMLDVMRANAAKMKELEDRKRECIQAAQIAKQHLALTKQREKAGIEATRAAMDAATSTQKSQGRGRGAKRAAPEETE